MIRARRTGWGRREGEGVGGTSKCSRPDEWSLSNRMCSRGMIGEFVSEGSCANGGRAWLGLL